MESRKYEQRGSLERERMNHLRLALDKLSFANSAYQGRPINLCLSDGEFDKHVRKENAKSVFNSNDYFSMNDTAENGFRNYNSECDTRPTIQPKKGRSLER